MVEYRARSDLDEFADGQRANADADDQTFETIETATSS